MTKLIACAMVLPMSTTNCECTFLAMRPLIDNLMRISIEGPIAAAFDFLQAVNNQEAWDQGKRRIASQFQFSSYKQSVLL